MITMALRVFLRYSLDKGDLRYTVRAWSAQDREMLTNFYMGVLGKTEGRVALSSVERFISKISTGQNLPCFTSENIFDLSQFLYESVQMTDRFRYRNHLYCKSDQEL